jgi:transcriptional regulator with XRE-family HTH domain
MSECLSAKLEFVLKALSLSRIQLAAELGVDKSVVGRWVTGAVRPSAHNLSRLTALIAGRVPGFNLLDWDRDQAGLASVLGVDMGAGRGVGAPVYGDGLPLQLLDQIASTTRLRGGAYEGLFRTVRPYAQAPGKFIHDHILIRRQPNELLRYDMLTGGVAVQGWVLLLQNQVFCMGSELTSGSIAFAIFNGVNTLQAGRLDGIILNCALDPGRTPTATAVVIDRVGELTDDPKADYARLQSLASDDPVAPEGSVAPDMAAHLLREIGPAQLALGGDLLLRMPLTRSLSRGTWTD